MATPLPFVIDCGSTQCRIGLCGGIYGPSSGPNRPTSTVRSRVGRKQVTPSVVPSAKELAQAALAAQGGLAAAKPPLWFGEALDAEAATLDVKELVVDGRIKNWNDAEQLWDEALQTQVAIVPSEHGALYVEPPLVIRDDREEVTRLMFEGLGVPSLYLANSAVMALYANNMTSGVAVCSGDTLGYAVPVHEAYVRRHMLQPLPYSGSMLTKFMVQQYALLGVGKLDTYQARLLKTQLCFVSASYERDLEICATSPALEDTFVLPDGKLVLIAKERFVVPELMFQPELGDEASWGTARIPASLQEQVLSTVLQFAPLLQDDLSRNILLVGGTAAMPGLRARLQSELTGLVESQDALGLAAPVVHTPRFGGSLDTWVGGSLVASLRSFPDLCITKAEYEEVGVAIASRKCQ